MKKIIVPLAIVAILGSWIGYQHFKPSSEQEIYNSLKNPAKSKLLSNESLKSENKKVMQSGLYTVDTSGKDTSAVSESDFVPAIGGSVTGVYLSKGEIVNVPAQSRVELTPVKFTHLGRSKEGRFTLKSLGKYAIGSTIQAGTYNVTLSRNEGTDKTGQSGVVQIYVGDYDKQSQQAELKSVGDATKLTLQKGQFLQIKASTPIFELSLSKN